MNQIKADILGVPVRTFQKFETTAIGAAMITLVGVGFYRDLNQSFQAFCKLDRIYEPNLARHQIYKEYFQLYQDVYQSLLGCYRQRAEILSKLQKDDIQKLTLAENL